MLTELLKKKKKTSPNVFNKLEKNPVTFPPPCGGFSFPLEMLHIFHHSTFTSKGCSLVYCMPSVSWGKPFQNWDL